MLPTRRTWTTAAIAVLLAAAAPVVDSVVPAVGAALVFGWLLAQQLIAVAQFQTTVEATTLTVDPSVAGVQVESEAPVTLRVERPPTAADTELTVTLPLPPAATPVDKSDRQVTLGVGDTQATTTVVVTLPTAGRMQFLEPHWQLTDSREAFTERFDRGPTPTVTAEAHSLRNLHVGRGGSELSAYGQHPTDGTGDGTTPAELRQYVGGDPADRIDWKATARLTEPYVREFEAESDREITLIVDHRSRLGADTPDNSPLAYIREVALSIVGNAESVGDPLGLITVGDEGLTTTVAATRSQVGYARIKEQLLQLEPTPAGPPRSAVDLQHPAATRRLIQQLAGDESTFASTLREFTATAPAYVERIQADPLYGAIEYLQATTTASQVTVILTTDRDRPQLRETVRAAASDDSAVLVFLTPQVLFDTSELGNLEAAYRRYREFEQFRTELERFGSVIAYEVGPGDRLASLLSSHRQRATTGGAQTP